jgi:serine/threonine protein kinase
MPEMKLDGFDIGQQIGRGGFATVYRSKNRFTDEDVAIKIIEKSNITTSDMMKRVLNEIRIHTMLDHYSIVRLIDHFEDDTAFYLIMDLCPNGNMFKFLRTEGPLAEDTVALYCNQILDALKYLQEKFVIHRDLKLSNLLIDGEYNIQLCDFGLATQLEHPDEEHFTICGTPNYIAPEIASQKAHGFPADLWALGCLCFSMLTGTPPFEHGGGVKETLENIVAGEYSIPRNVIMSQEAQDFIRCLLHVVRIFPIPIIMPISLSVIDDVFMLDGVQDPRSRASADQVKRHPFLARRRRSLPQPSSLSSPPCSVRQIREKGSRPVDALRSSFDGGGATIASTATTALASYDSRGADVDEGECISIRTSTRDDFSKRNGYPLTPMYRPPIATSSRTPHRYGSSRKLHTSTSTAMSRSMDSSDFREQYSRESATSFSSASYKSAVDSASTASHRSSGAGSRGRGDAPRLGPRQEEAVARRSHDESSTSVAHSRHRHYSDKETSSSRQALRHSYDNYSLSADDRLVRDSPPSGSPSQRGGAHALPLNWRDSLQCLRQNMSMSSSAASAASARHSASSLLSDRHQSYSQGLNRSCDRSEDNMSWSLESSSSHRHTAAASTDNSFASLPSAVSSRVNSCAQSLSRPNESPRGKGRSVLERDFGHSRLWVPRLSPSQRRDRRDLEQSQPSLPSSLPVHSKAFSYCSPRGDVLVMSTAGDVVFCTYLKDKAGRLRPCRLLVRARDPLQLHVGKVDKAMCQEILSIRDESHNPQGDSSTPSGDKKPLTIFSDALWMRKYHVTSLPSFLTPTYSKVSRMLSLARKKMPKLILYITKPPVSDRSYHYLHDQAPPAPERSNGSGSAAESTPSAPLLAPAAGTGGSKGEVLCKCMLMSNTPLPDFYMRWADGTRLSYSLELSQLHLSHSSDKTKAYRWDGERTGDSDWTDSAPKGVRRYLAEAQVAMRKCLAQEGRGRGTGGRERGRAAEFPIGGAPQILVDTLDTVDSVVGESIQ